MNNHERALEMYAAIQAKKKLEIKQAILKDHEINNYSHYMEKRRNRGRSGWCSK